MVLLTAMRPSGTQAHTLVIPKESVKRIEPIASGFAPRTHRAQAVTELLGPVRPGRLGGAKPERHAIMGTRVTKMGRGIANRRRWIIVAVVLVAFLTTGAGLLWMNVAWLARQLAERQFAGLTVANVEVRWNELLLEGVVYTPPGEESVSIQAARVHLRPSFLSFLRDRIEIPSAELESTELRVVRMADGSLRLPVPPPPEAPEPAPTRALLVERLQAAPGIVTFIDQSTGAPYARLGLTDISLDLQNLRLPAEPGRIPFRLAAGLEPQGEMRAAGWIDSVGRSADLEVHLQGLPLAQVQPYLRDRLDTSAVTALVGLQADWSMSGGRYTVTGEIFLSDLQFESGSRLFGIPVATLSTYLQRLEGQTLSVPFDFTGDISQSPMEQGLATVLVQSLILQLGAPALETLRDEITREDLETLREQLRKGDIRGAREHLRDRARELRDRLP
jgi:hypothetical protein